MTDKIAFFVISTHLGGAERSLLDFLKEVTDKKQSLVVVTPKKTGPLIDELTQLNIPTSCIPLPSWFLKVSKKRKAYSFMLAPILPFLILKHLMQIHLSITENKITKIHSTGLKYHILLCLYSLFNKQIHFFIHLRDIIHSRGLLLFFQFYGSSKNVHFIANSSITADSLAALQPTLIYNGFDSKTYHKENSQLKQRLNIPKDHKLVAIIGVIARWKGQREFLQAAHSILQKRNDIHFLIVGNEIYDTSGENGELSYLKAQARQEHSQQNIHFLDFQKNLIPIYSGLDALAHCSIHPEPFGRVIVEAMMCQCPVTASNEGGPLEIIEPNQNGLLHDIKNIKSLTSNILKLIDDPQFSLQLTEKALDDSQRFSMDNYVKNMKEQLFKS